MSIKASLFSYLSTALAALVGDRVYPGVIPQQVFGAASKRPCIVYRRQGLEQTITTCGPDFVRRTVFAFDCYARTYVAADEVAEALKAAMVGYVGDMAGTPVDQVALEDEFDAEDTDPGLFRDHVVLAIWHH